MDQNNQTCSCSETARDTERSRDQPGAGNSLGQRDLLLPWLGIPALHSWNELLRLYTHESTRCGFLGMHSPRLSCDSAHTKQRRLSANPENSSSVHRAQDALHSSTWSRFCFLLKSLCSSKSLSSSNTSFTFAEFKLTHLCE